MTDEIRLIAIDDAGMRINIPGFGIVRGPVSRVRVTVGNLSKLYNMYNGPKFIFFVDSDNFKNRVRVTAENITWPENKIFGKEEKVVEEVKPAPVLEEINVEEFKSEPVVEETDYSLTEAVEALVESKVEETETEDIVTDTLGYIDTTGEVAPEVQEAPVVTTDTRSYKSYSNYKKRH